MILSPARRLEIEAQLREARSAYHALITGTMARVVVDQNGERVEFVASNRGSLYTYIQKLESELAAGSGCLPAVSGPARFFF